MSVKEIDGKWFTVSRAGKTGKRGWATEAIALAAQNRGRALLASSGGGASLPSSAVEPATALSDDTSEERKALGIPPKATPKADSEAF